MLRHFLLTFTAMATLAFITVSQAQDGQCVGNAASCSGQFSADTCTINIPLGTGECDSLRSACNDLSGCEDIGCDCEFDTDNFCDGACVNSVSCTGTPNPCSDVMSESDCAKVAGCSWRVPSPVSTPGSAPTVANGVPGTECTDESDLMATDDYLGRPVDFAVFDGDWWCVGTYAACTTGGVSRSVAATQGDCLEASDRYLGMCDDTTGDDCVLIAVERTQYYAATYPGKYNDDEISDCGSTFVFSAGASALEGTRVAEPYRSWILECIDRAAQAASDAEEAINESDSASKAQGVNNNFRLLMWSVMALGIGCASWA